MHTPPTNIISQAAENMRERANSARQENAITRAEYQMKANGAMPIGCATGWLVKSAGSNTVYRVDTVYGCDCKAGRNGNPCWHAALIDLLAECNKSVMPSLPRSRVLYEPDTSEWFGE